MESDDLRKFSGGSDLQLLTEAATALADPLPMAHPSMTAIREINAPKQSVQAIASAREYAEAIVRTARDRLVILNADLRVHLANEAFYSTFKVSAAEAAGRLIYELGNRQWNIPKLSSLLEDILPRNSFFDNFEVTHDVERLGRRAMLGYAREEFLGKELWQIGLLKDERSSHATFRELQQRGRVRYEDLPLETKSGEKCAVEVVANCYAENGQQVIQCNIRDITERKRAEEAVAESHAELQSHTEELTRFNRVAVGRESRMIELKQEVNDICQRHGEAARYPLEFEQDAEDLQL